MSRADDVSLFRVDAVRSDNGLALVTKFSGSRDEADGIFRALLAGDTVLEPIVQTVPVVVAEMELRNGDWTVISRELVVR